jgi:hypothetical protein
MGIVELSESSLPLDHLNYPGRSLVLKMGRHYVVKCPTELLNTWHAKSQNCTYVVRVIVYGILYAGTRICGCRVLWNDWSGSPFLDFVP